MGATLGYSGKRSSGPWWGDERRRLVFELGARRFFRDLRGGSGKGPHGEGRYYRFRLDVPGFDSRRMEIVFSKKSTMYPNVYVDGPDDSPHRYRVEGEDSTLCMWYPQDPPDQKWIFEDGLHELLALIAAHLFREAWWREYGEWLGPVSPHAVPKKRAKND